MKRISTLLHYLNLPWYIWLPIIIITYITVATLFTANINPGDIGYTSNGEVLYPGNHFKSPFTTFERQPLTEHHINIHIPCQTTDGLQLDFILTMLFVTWDPKVYNELYDHNEEVFINAMIKRLKPHVDTYMSHVTERDFELNDGSYKSELTAILTEKAHPHPGLTHKPNMHTAQHTGRFMYKSNPKHNYTCVESSGLCNAFDSALNNKNQPSIDSPPPTPLPPLPTMTTIPESELPNLPSSQSDIDRIIQEVIAEQGGQGYVIINE